MVGLAIELDENPRCRMGEVSAAHETTPLVSELKLGHGLRQPRLGNCFPEQILEGTLRCVVPPATLFEQRPDHADTAPAPATHAGHNPLDVLWRDHVTADPLLESALNDPLARST